MAQLIVENGPGQGSRISLSREAPCHLGRDPDCDVVVPDGEAGKAAVVKSLRGGGFGVKCIEGTVLVNGDDVEAARLREGDMIETGGVRLRYSEVAAGSDSPSRPGSGSGNNNGNGKRAVATHSGQTLGGFRLGEVLGTGGMGVVYRAEQISLNREVALKVLSKDLTQDPVFVARFVAEARAAARLHHPNAVQVFDVGHQADTYFYSMELMHEGTVEDRLRERGRLEVDEALGVIADAARGLAYAESLRIVHRDIKPENLMIDRLGTVKIADLGLAMSDEDDHSRVVGTPHFMSPEQALRKPLDHRSDLYSLGCTFYRLLTGQVPFKRASVKEILRAHVKDTPAPVAELASDVPAEVQGILDRLLAKDPDERYPSANDLLADIEAVLRPPVRKTVWIAGIAVAVLIAGGGLAWGLTRPEGETLIKTVKEKDPRVAPLLEDIRQKDAEIARLQVLAGGLTGAAKADALEAVAQAHPDTDAGARALEDANAVRTELARVAAAEAAKQQRIDDAVHTLQGRVGDEMSQGHYAAALALLNEPPVDESLVGAEAVTAAIAGLRKDLEQQAGERLHALRAAVADARGAGDLDGLRKAVASLAEVLEGESAWPDELLAESSVARATLTEGREAVAELVDRREAARAAAAWQTYTKAFLGEQGVLARVDALDLQGAASQAGSIAEQLGEGEAAAHAHALAESLSAAAAFLQRFQDAAQAGGLELKVPGYDDPRPVAEFTPTGPDAGLTVKVGPVVRPRSEKVPIERLRGAALAQVFRLPDDDPQADDHAAFLAWVGLADALDQARAYLGRVQADDVESGTGEQGFPDDGDVLAIALDTLQDSDADWAKALRGEVSSARLLERALRAFSSKRNLSAANHLDRLRGEHEDSLVVRALD